MSESTYDLSCVIALPFPRPVQGADGQWRRTWRVRMCTPPSDPSWPELARRPDPDHAGIAVARHGERELEVVVEHAADAFSDESFVFGPARLFAQIEERVGRIELIEGVARSLWSPFRPAFHRVISNPSLDPVREVLEQAVRTTLDRPGWEQALIVHACGKPLRFSEINFGETSELSLVREPASGLASIQWAVLRDDLVLLAPAHSSEILSIVRQVEGEMDDRWTKGLALAS